MSTRLVTFDLDGTLYEAARVRLRFLWAAFPHTRIMRVGKRVREELSGRRFDSGDALVDEEARVVAERVGVDVAAARALLHELYDVRLTRVLARVGPRPQTRATLEALVARQIAIAVISDRGAVDDKLAALGLADLPWAARVAADDVGALKPHASLLADVAARVGIDASAVAADVVHVGDRDDKDGALARAVGCAFQLVPARGPLTLPPSLAGAPR